MKGFFLSIVFMSAVAIAQPAFVPGEILVKFRQESSSALSLKKGDRIADSINELGISVVKLRPGINLFDAIKEYRGNKDVVWAEPNYIASIEQLPNDPNYSLQWGLTSVNAESAWLLTKGSAEVVIAIVDTGVDLNHPELVGKTVPGYDFVNRDAVPNDDNGHGTHCAGIAAASTDNGVGIAGVSWSSQIMPVKVLDSKGNGSYSNIANGILFASKNGAKVISVSAGGLSASSTLQSAVNAAWASGSVVICAAGNNGNTTPFYPAFYSNAIAVGAIDNFDQKTWYTNFGSWVDVAAPGDNVFSTLPNGSFGYKYGTSMAAPFVAGQAALIFSKYGLFSPASFVRNKIESSTTNIGSWLSKGKINLFASLNVSLEETSDQRYEFEPNNYWVSKGKRSAGGLKELLLSDNKRLDIVSSRYSAIQELEWTAQAKVSFPGVPERIELTVETSSIAASLANAEILNVQSNQFESMGNNSVSQSDLKTMFLSLGDCSKYIASTGTVTVRYRVSPLQKLTQAKFSTDWVRVAVVTQ